MAKAGWGCGARVGACEALLLSVLMFAVFVQLASASTYVVYIPLDSPIYNELSTLDGLGYLDTYLDEIKPISRMEAARLTLEAQANLREAKSPDRIAVEMIHALRRQLHDEVGWLNDGEEDNLPTMFHPLHRVEAQYVFSSGEPRRWITADCVGTISPNCAVPGRGGIYGQEGTPLLPNNDGLPTAPGSNEIVRMSGWAGLGGFFTGYAEGAAAGPLTRDVPGRSRAQLLGAEAVMSLGNFAVSFGQEEMWWGTGHFGALSVGDNAPPFPAARIQNIHPTYLPWFLRYLGPFRFQIFFGQLDAGNRYFADPWIDGQIFSFKPLPDFEFGFTHMIDFGGRHNNFYGFAGFLGRATAFSTGSPQVGNTHQRGGIYLKFRFPRYRNLIVYQEMNGADNLTYEIPVVGRFLPFLSVSYQGGFYLPRLTADGLTDLRFEYSILEPNYLAHSDSLYYTYDGYLMGDPIGPNATRVDIQVGRWVRGLNKVTADIFYTEQAPNMYDYALLPIDYPYPLEKEHSVGAAIGFMRVPEPLTTIVGPGLASLEGRVAAEYTTHINYAPIGRSVRVMVMLSTSFNPGFTSYVWK
jgi:hypothetical protein